jgi:hypothetical protein
VAIPGGAQTVLERLLLNNVDGVLIGEWNGVSVCRNDIIVSEIVPVTIR